MMRRTSKSNAGILRPLLASAQLVSTTPLCHAGSLTGTFTVGAKHLCDGSNHCGWCEPRRRGREGMFMQVQVTDYQFKK